MNLWRILITLGIIIIIPVLIYSYQGNINLDDFWTQVAVGAVLIIPIIAVWGIKPLLERMQTRPKLQEQKEHTVDLMNIYKRLCKTGIREDRDGFQIVLPKKYKEFSNIESEIIDMQYHQSTYWEKNYVSLEYRDHYSDYEYLEDALKHLTSKPYKETYNHWTKTKSLLDEFNKRSKFRSKLYETIESKMKEMFPDFKKGYGEVIESCFDPYVIGDVVTNLWFVERVRFDFLEIRDKYGYPSIITKYGTRPQLSSSNKDKLNLDKYKKLLESLVTNNSLKQMLIDENHAFSEIHTELETFQEKLRLIIKNHKHKIISGNCESCP